MTRKISSGTPWEPVAGYSRAVAAGDYVFVAGCTSVTGGEVVHEGDAAAQTTQAIATLAPLGVEGAIVGKALYAGAFTLEQALEAVKQA